MNNRKRNLSSPSREKEKKTGEEEFVLLLVTPLSKRETYCCVGCSALHLSIDSCIAQLIIHASLLLDG
jgi:hypothetical protein